MNAAFLTSDDEVLEAKISEAWPNLATAADHAAQSYFCGEMYRLINKRSLARIAQMESELFGHVLIRSGIPPRGREFTRGEHG